MKTAYPVIFTKLSDGYAAHVPDFPLDTQGDDLPEAIFMARDAIGLMGIILEDDKKPLPTPSVFESMSCGDGEFVSMVDIDFDEYRRKNDNRTVRRNIALPAWLDEAVKESNINVSGFIQSALKEHLNIQRV